MPGPVAVENVAGGAVEQPARAVTAGGDALEDRRSRAAASGQSDPLDQVKVATQLLFELSRPDPVAQRPLFTDFAPQL
ncbi:MAG: hypothetical protein ABIS86_20345 [Streptosporangiaceae bacterium]